MENITIPMEEYKELLIIKGKYEELKGSKTIEYSPYTPSTTYPYTPLCQSGSSRSNITTV